MIHTDIPTLRPTSSPELDESLNRFRQQVIIPYGLSETQRHSIFRSQHAKNLNDNPVIISIGHHDEQYRLLPIAKKDLPSRQEVMKTLKLMKEANDWSNLVPFIIGIRPRYPLGLATWEMLARWTGASGAMAQLVTCAQMSKQTGLQLNNTRLVERLFFEIHCIARRVDFKGPTHEKAERIAKQFITEMEAPGHAAIDNTPHPRKHHSVIAVLLELAAARAIETGSKEDHGRIQALAQRLLASWSLRQFNLEDLRWGLVEQALQQFIVVHNAIKFALQVDGIVYEKSVSSQLKTVMNELGMLIQKTLNSAPQEIKDKDTRAFSEARKLGMVLV
ncbi:hypothetical protein BJX99DRAFT_253338 [Aspergillus californicus]